MTQPTPLSRRVSRAERFGNTAFRTAAWGFAWLTVLLVGYIVYTIGVQASPAIRQFGLRFLTQSTWDPNTDVYGILPEIWGTLYSSVLALVIGTVFGLAAAVFLSEHLLAALVFHVLRALGLQARPFWRDLPARAEDLLKNLVELLAAIPSVVYGLWGIFVLIPLVRPLCWAVQAKLGWLPVFSTHLVGPGILPAALVLSIMILPTITAISRDALAAVPVPLREAAYGLGATPWETILGVTLPAAARGIFGAVVLAFGRALGETMALAMLIGNANVISWSLFSPGNTLAAQLANAFPEASSALQVSVLMYAALVLLGITLLVNSLGALIVERATRLTGGHE